VNEIAMSTGRTASRYLSQNDIAMIQLRYITRAATQTDMAREYGRSFWTINHHIKQAKLCGYPFGRALNDASDAWARRDYAGVASALRSAANLVENNQRSA
jgi:hypothetical protein